MHRMEAREVRSIIASCAGTDEATVDRVLRTLGDTVTVGLRANETVYVSGLAVFRRSGVDLLIDLGEADAPMPHELDRLIDDPDGTDALAEFLRDNDIDPFGTKFDPHPGVVVHKPESVSEDDVRYKARELVSRPWPAQTIADRVVENLRAHVS